MGALLDGVLDRAVDVALVGGLGVWALDAGTPPGTAVSLVAAAADPTLDDLAAAIVDVTGSSSPIEHPYPMAYEPGFEDMERRVPHIGQDHRPHGMGAAAPAAGDPRGRDRVRAARPAEVRPGRGLSFNKRP